MSIFNQALKFSNDLDDASIEELKAEMVQEDEERYKSLINSRDMHVEELKLSGLFPDPDIEDWS